MESTETGPTGTLSLSALTFKFPTWIDLASHLYPSFEICLWYHRWCSQFCRWSLPACHWKEMNLYSYPSHRPIFPWCRWSRTGPPLGREEASVKTQLSCRDSTDVIHAEETYSNPGIPCCQRKLQHICLCSFWPFSFPPWASRRPG